MRNLDETLVDYEWDYDSGVARLVYENRYTGEERVVLCEQFNHWVNPRNRVPLPNWRYN